MKTFRRIWMLAGSLAWVSVAPAKEVVEVKCSVPEAFNSLFCLIRVIRGPENFFSTADDTDDADEGGTVVLGRQMSRRSVA